MELCEYQSVENKSALRKPFFRQLVICSGIWISVFMYGLGVGAPTVFIPQIRRQNNSTIVISDEMASWISSIYGFSGFPCVILLSILTKFVGRKIPYIVAAVDSLAAFIFLYCSTNITHIIIGEMMQGLFSASQLVVTVTLLTEYTSPKYRGVFLTIKSATFYWGIWASNAIGTLFHWRIITLCGIACACYTLLTVCIWPESPYWLASQGKFEECARSHRWLKGCDEESEKELEALIKKQKEYIAGSNDDKLSMRERVVDIFKTIKSKEFYKPTSLSVLSGILITSTGKLVCTVYAIDILKNITSSESAAYAGMLIMDGITVFSMYCGCIISRYFKRRTLIMLLSTATVIIIFMISLYLYLISLHLITENKYVTISFLMVFSITVSCGPLIVCATVLCEIIPLKSRNLSVCIVALIGKLAVGTSLKIAPYFMKTFNLHGTFMSFGISTSICILLLYKYLPETKDKTLQEIAESMKVVKLKRGVNKEAKPIL